MSYSSEPPNYGAPPPPPPGGGGYGAQPPGYGGQGYGGQPQQNSVMAIISLVTGILGVTCCCGSFIVSGAALVLGILGKKEIAESGGAKKGAGMAQAGFILGIVGLVLGVLYWILYFAGAISFSYTDFD